MPYTNYILKSTRESPRQWDPEYTMTQYKHQSNYPYEEQKVALKVNVQHINKYTTTSGHASLIYTKIIITYGSPGTGKSFIGQIVVFYALSQGLNIVSTALMGVRVNNFWRNTYAQTIHISYR